MASTRQTHNRRPDTSGERPSRAGREPEPESTAPEAATLAVDHVATLTAREAVGATSVEPTDDGWRVEVEVVEENRIPSTSDILALYTVDLDPYGELLAYRRTRRYLRGRTD